MVDKSEHSLWDGSWVLWQNSFLILWRLKLFLDSFWASLTLILIRKQIDIVSYFKSLQNLLWLCECFSESYFLLEASSSLSRDLICHPSQNHTVLWSRSFTGGVYRSTQLLFSSPGSEKHSKVKSRCYWGSKTTGECLTEGQNTEPAKGHHLCSWSSRLPAGLYE